VHGSTPVDSTYLGRRIIHYGYGSGADSKICTIYITVPDTHDVELVVEADVAEWVND
jgi:3-hydroxy-3-methylglutaryl CoA synthase